MTAPSRPGRLLHGPAEHPELDERTAMTQLGYQRRADHPWVRCRVPTPLTTAPPVLARPEGTRGEQEFESDAELTG